MNKTQTSFLLAEFGLAVGLLACRGRPEPQATEQQNTPVPAVQGEIALTPEAQPATVPLVEMTYPMLSTAPKAYYETFLPEGETIHITAYGTEGIDFIPVAFTDFIEFLEEHVVGETVFAEDDLPITAGNVALKSRPQGPHHFFNIVRNAIALNPQESTNQTVTREFMADRGGNSICNIPTGDTEQSLKFGVAEGLFDLAVIVESDAFYENPNTATTIRQSYSAAFLAAQDGRSYEGYQAFANDLYEQGLLDNKPMFVTFEAYVDLTAAVANYKLPAFFTISTTQ